MAVRTTLIIFDNIQSGKVITLLNGFNVTLLETFGSGQVGDCRSLCLEVDYLT